LPQGKKPCTGEGNETEGGGGNGATNWHSARIPHPNLARRAGRRVQGRRGPKIFGLGEAGSGVWGSSVRRKGRTKEVVLVVVVRLTTIGLLISFTTSGTCEGSSGIEPYGKNNPLSRKTR